MINLDMALTGPPGEPGGTDGGVGRRGERGVEGFDAALSQLLLALGMPGPPPTAAPPQQPVAEQAKQNAAPGAEPPTTAAGPPPGAATPVEARPDPLLWEAATTEGPLAGAAMTSNPTRSAETGVSGGPLIDGSETEGDEDRSQTPPAEAAPSPRAVSTMSPDGVTARGADPPAGLARAAEAVGEALERRPDTTGLHRALELLTAEGGPSGLAGASLEGPAADPPPDPNEPLPDGVEDAPPTPTGSAESAQPSPTIGEAAPSTVPSIALSPGDDTGGRTFGPDGQRIAASQSDGDGTQAPPPADVIPEIDLSVAAEGGDPASPFPSAASAALTPTGATTEVDVTIEPGTVRMVHERTVPELTERISVLLRDGIQEARIRLDPPELGEVRIRLTFESGRLQVEIHADRGATREALAVALPELRHALETRQLSPERIDLGFGGNDLTWSGTPDRGEEPAEREPATTPLARQQSDMRFGRSTDPSGSSAAAGRIDYRA